MTSSRLLMSITVKFVFQADQNLQQRYFRQRLISNLVALPSVIIWSMKTCHLSLINWIQKKIRIRNDVRLSSKSNWSKETLPFKYAWNDVNAMVGRWLALIWYRYKTYRRFYTEREPKIPFNATLLFHQIFSPCLDVHTSKLRRMFSAHPKGTTEMNSKKKGDKYLTELIVYT